MKVILDGKEVDIELSEKSQKELDKLNDELNLPEYAKNIRCVDENARQKMIKEYKERDNEN